MSFYKIAQRRLPPQESYLAFNEESEYAYYIGCVAVMVLSNSDRRRDVKAVHHHFMVQSSKSGGLLRQLSSLSALILPLTVVDHERVPLVHHISNLALII